MKQLVINRMDRTEDFDVYLDGQCRDCIEVEDGAVVRIRLVQRAQTPPKGLLWSYLRQLALHGRLEYGTTIPNPYAAEFEAAVAVSEDMELHIQLQKQKDGSVFYCQEQLACIPGSVVCRRRNMHRGIWLILFFLLAFPIYAISLLGLVSVWKGCLLEPSDIPLVAAALVTVVYVAVCFLVTRIIWKRANAS